MTLPYVVALVSSAGGLHALIDVLGGLPADFPAPVLALQHGDPTARSEIPALLDRRTALSVVAAEDGAPLVAGQVLVAPPGFHLLITPARAVALVVSGPYPPSRPSADLLLTTLAISCGPAAIAVVLTGGGNDGATGATAVHHFGGTVLATDQASSSSFSMPAATIDRDHAVDAVLPQGEVAAALTKLVERPR